MNATEAISQSNKHVEPNIPAWIQVGDKIYSVDRVYGAGDLECYAVVWQAGREIHPSER